MYKVIKTNSGASAALVSSLAAGGPVPPGLRVQAMTPSASFSTAEASEDLLSRRAEWLPGACEVLDGPDGVYTIAPAERLSSARQSALMIREGPRRQAAACETGDWAHVDVYLTKTLDYRAILFAGSRYDEQAMDWVRQRGAKVLAIGLDVPGARRVIRYRHDEEPDVALVTETLIAELVAAQWWVYAP